MSTRAAPRAALAVAVLVQLIASALLLSHVAGVPSSADVTASAVAQPTTASAALRSPAQSPNAQAGLSPASHSSRDGVRHAAVQVLLDRWAAALRAGDVATLADLFDPGADVGFLDREERRAANLADVPLSDWGYGIGNGPPLTVPPAVVTRTGADELWAPPIELHYALAGADPAPTTRPVGLVLARRGAVWRLVSDTAVTDYGRTTWRGPWDFGPVIARSVDRGVVLGHPAHADAVESLAADLDAAVNAVTDFWGPDWSQRGAVFVPDTQAELTALVGADFAGGEIAAVATADEIDRGKQVARGQRVVFNPATINQLTALSRRVVLRHELTHVAARVRTAPQVPMWLAEGFADYSGYRDSGVSLANGAPAVAALVRTAGPPDSLPTDIQFAAGTSRARVELAYQLAWTFSVFLATVKGEPVLRAFYLAVAALPGPSVTDIDAVLQEMMGTNLATLVREWGQWLSGTLR